MSIRLLMLTGLLMQVGCATTVVKKDPGSHDKGIRFYRPKPYLLIQPAIEQSLAVKTDEGKTVGAVVANGSDRSFTVELKYMPDFSEEYSIRARSGIGTNTTNITLADGWNLTQVDQALDSNVPETISALGDLIQGVGNIASQNVAPGRGSGSTDVKFVVQASNVPIGFYEAVLSDDPSGHKQLYGWRYIGFAPYSPCPIVSCGQVNESCGNSAIYALAFENGVMKFKSLPEVANGSSQLTPSSVLPDVEQMLANVINAALVANSKSAERVIVSVQTDGNLEVVIITSLLNATQDVADQLRAVLQDVTPTIRKAIAPYGYSNPKVIIAPN